MYVQVCVSVCLLNARIQTRLHEFTWLICLCIAYMFVWFAWLICVSVLGVFCACMWCKYTNLKLATHTHWCISTQTIQLFKLRRSNCIQHTTKPFMEIHNNMKCMHATNTENETNKWCKSYPHACNKYSQIKPCKYKTHCAFNKHHATIGQNRNTSQSCNKKHKHTIQISHIQTHMQQITQTKHATYTNATSKYANQQCKYTQYKTAHVCSKTSKTETHNHSNTHAINKTLTYKTTIIITHSQQTCTHIHNKHATHRCTQQIKHAAHACKKHSKLMQTCKSIMQITHTCMQQTRELAMRIFSVCSCLHAHVYKWFHYIVNLSALWFIVCLLHVLHVCGVCTINILHIL